MRNFDKMIDQRKKNSEGIETRIRNPRNDICRGLENLNIKCEEREGSSANIFKCEVNDLKKDSQKLQTKTDENKENDCTNDSKDGKFICNTLHRSKAKEEVTETNVLLNGVEYSHDSPVILKENKNSEDNGNETVTNQTEKDVIQNSMKIKTLTCSKENSCSTERNIEQNVNSDSSESGSSEENKTSEEVEEKEKNNSTTEQILLPLEKLQIKETKDDEEEERSNEPQETQETSESRENDLCSRGPIHNQNFRKHVSQAPYLFSQSRQCGGIVEVQDKWSPVNTFEPNIKLNIDTEFQDQNHNPVPQQLSSVTSSIGNNGESGSSQDLIKTMLEQYPCLIDIVDIIATEWQGQNTACNIDNAQSNDKSSRSTSKSSSGSIKKGSSDYSEDESYSTSPVGSPHVGFSSYNHPSPSGASIASSSGVSSIKGSPRYINESFNETSNESYASIWVKKYTQCLRPICPKPPPTKIDPNSYKSKLMKKLDDDQKLNAWARVHSFKNEVLCAGDKDGDTNLMIIVTNKHDSQKEYIYAMVERMRNIPGALSQKNVAGHSALYLASLEMCDEPIIAAYIAETLVEQNVDIAEETYDGLTLPQILQRKGEPCKGVLRELLQLKNRSGQFVFHSFLNDGCDVNVQ